MVDLRYHWTRQKRLQGSHGTNDPQARAYNQLMCDGLLDPCLGRTITFDQIPRPHAEMASGQAPSGNTVALVGATEPGLGLRS